MWIAMLASAVYVTPAILNAVCVAPSSPYYNGLLVVIAVVLSFALQLLTFGLLFIPDALLDYEHQPPMSMRKWLLRYGGNALLTGASMGLISFIALLSWPWIQAHNASISVAFVGGILVKTLVFPLVKGLVTGTLFKKLLEWVRRDDDKPKA